MPTNTVDEAGLGCAVLCRPSWWSAWWPPSVMKGRAWWKRQMMWFTGQQSRPLHRLMIVRLLRIFVVECIMMSDASVVALMRRWAMPYLLVMMPARIVRQSWYSVQMMMVELLRYLWQGGGRWSWQLCDTGQCVVEDTGCLDQLNDRCLLVSSDPVRADPLCPWWLGEGDRSCAWCDLSVCLQLLILIV